jgi:hypothetical protein
MEKFRRFGDVATGVNPFVSPTPKLSLAALALAPLRIICVVVVSIVLFVVDSLAVGLRVLGLATVDEVTLPRVTTVLRRLWMRALASLAVQCSAFPARPAAPHDIVVPVSWGDVVLANLVSPFDAMLAEEVAHPYRPMFVFVAHSCRASQPEITCLDFGPTQRWRAMKFIFKMTERSGRFIDISAKESGELNPAASLPIDLADIIKRAKATRSVAVVFAEGATSNGKGILPFPALFCSAQPASHALHLANFKYSSPRYVRVIDDVPWWVFALAAGGSRLFFGEAAAITAARPSALSLISNSSEASLKLRLPPLPSMEWTQAVRERLAAVSGGGCRAVAVGVLQKRAYAAYWQQSR